MANKIILKRGADSGISTLTPNSVGEPAWGTTSNKLYVATGTSSGNWEWVGAGIQAQADLDNDFSQASNTKIATSSAIKDYVDAQITAVPLNFVTDTGSGSVDLDSQSLTFTSGEGIDITHSGQAVTIAGELASTSNVGSAKFASADFDVSNAGEVTINSIGNAQIDNSYVTVSADSGSADAVNLGETLAIVGTANEVETAVSANQIQVGLPSNVTISGNLTVNGTMTTANAQQVEIGDVNILMAKENSANSVDIGFYGKYVASGTKYKGIYSDQDNADTWTFFKTAGTAPGNTVATDNGYALAGISCASVDNATLDGGEW